MKVLPLLFTGHTYFLWSLDGGTEGLTNLPWSASAAWAGNERPQGKGLTVGAMAVPSPPGEDVAIGARGLETSVCPGREDWPILSPHFPGPQLFQVPGWKGLDKGDLHGSFLP